MSTQAWIAGGIGDLAGRDADDIALASRAVGDPAVFEALYRRHYRMVAGYLYRRTGDVHAAEDLAAETFFAAFRSLAKMNSRGVAPRLWLLRVATNQAHRWHRTGARRARREAAAGVRESAGDGSRGEQWTESQARVREAISGLPARFEAVVSLHYLAGLGVEEIAAAIGTKSGTVKSRLSRGRELLRRVLDGSGGAA